MSEPERTGGLPASRPAGRTSGVGRGSGAWRALVPAIALLAGMLFATSAETAQGTDLRAGRRIELTQLITAEERSVGDATRQVVRLQGEVDGLQRQASASDGRVGSQRSAGDRLGAYVGLRPIRG